MTKQTNTTSKNLRKGELTRAAIVDSALVLASRDGLEGLTIGLLADKMNMSKSGVFSHFGSREDLQIEVIKRYHRDFENEVFYPSIKAPRGLPRLKLMFAFWTQRVATEISSGCIYISGAAEYDDRPGTIRDQLVEMVCTWQEALLRCVRQAVEAGHLQLATDPEQIVYEMYGLILALHHDARFIKRPGSAERTQIGFERMLNNYINPSQSPYNKPGFSQNTKTAANCAAQSA